MKIRKTFNQKLVGIDFETTGAKNASLMGLKGRIINQTRNIITIRTGKGKKQVTTMAEISNKKFRIEGAEMDAHPEDRAKVN